MTIGNDEVEEDSSVKQEVEGEMEPSADEDVRKCQAEVGEMDQSAIEFVIHWLQSLLSYHIKRKTGN